MTSAVPVQGSAIQPVESLSKFSFCLDIAQRRPRKGTSAPGRGSYTLSMTNWGSSRMLGQAEQLTDNETFPAHLHEQQVFPAPLSFCWLGWIKNWASP
jgi:hypothetical protein